MPAYAPYKNTGFTSISDWLEQKRGTLANEAGAVATPINNQLDAARTAADSVAAGATPGVSATDALTNANAFASGVSPGQLRSAIPGLGDRSFESQLVGVAGAPAFAGIRQK